MLNLSTFLLVVICLVMGAMVAIEAANPPQLDRQPVTTPPEAVLPDNLESPPAGNFALPPLDAYSEIVERPLFISSRRPPEEPEVVEQKQPGEVSFTLLGVAVTPERNLALLQIDGAGKVARMEVGEEVNGWQLEAVHADGIVLRKNETIKNVPLVRKSKPAPSKIDQAAPHENNETEDGSAVSQEQQIESEAGTDLPAFLGFRKKTNSD